MLGRVKRKLSRTKSVSDPPDQPHQPVGPRKPGHDLSTLTLSDEHLLSQLNFTLDENAELQHPPRPLPAYEIPVFTQQTERTVINSPHSGLLSLPTEVLLCLKEYLKPSSEVALRYSCSRFFYLYTSPSFYLTGDEQFDFICMIERDQDPTHLERLVCGRCRELHNKSAFPVAEIKQLPLDRDCQQVWLCPHKAMGFRKTVRSLKAGTESPFRAETLEPCSRCREVIRNRSISDRPERGTSQMDLDSPEAQTLLVTKIAILQRPSPVYNLRSLSGTMYKEIFGVRDVSSALHALDFRICPHIKLGDPCMLSKFCRNCLNTQKLPPDVKGPPCISSWNTDTGEREDAAKCRGACFDRSCKTKWMFQTRESLQPDASGRLQVWLIIVAYRWLGPLVSSGPDRHWREHAVDHSERVVMRKKYDQWSKGKIPMPNWSICLWNPEDSNLR